MKLTSDQQRSAVTSSSDSERRLQGQATMALNAGRQNIADQGKFTDKGIHNAVKDLESLSSTQRANLAQQEKGALNGLKARAELTKAQQSSDVDSWRTAALNNAGNLE